MEPIIKIVLLLMFIVFIFNLIKVMGRYFWGPVALIIYGMWIYTGIRIGHGNPVVFFILLISLIPAFIIIPKYYKKIKTYWINNKVQSYTYYNMQDIDVMDGYEFEEYIALLLKKLDYYKIDVSPYSGDYGIDVIAYKNQSSYGFQCKRWKGNVSVSAVQEVIAGCKYYDLDIPVIITNSYLTVAAKKMAIKLNVLIYDREKLKKMIYEANKN